jgi:hypothetical protein
VASLPVLVFTLNSDPPRPISIPTSRRLTAVHKTVGAVAKMRAFHIDVDMLVK